MVDIGDRFEEVRESLFGGARRQWVVVHQRPGPIPHVTIRDLTGTLSDKSISVAALMASRWYLPVQATAKRASSSS